MMYKVSQVAKMVGVTQSAVYKVIKQLNGQYVSVEQGRTMITEDGLLYFRERFRSKEDKESEQNSDIVQAQQASPDNNVFYICDSEHWRWYDAGISVQQAASETDSHGL